MADRLYTGQIKGAGLCGMAAVVLDGAGWYVMVSDVRNDADDAVWCAIVVKAVACVAITDGIA